MFVCIWKHFVLQVLEIKWLQCPTSKHPGRMFKPNQVGLMPKCKQTCVGTWSTFQSLHPAVHYHFSHESRKLHEKEFINTIIENVHWHPRPCREDHIQKGGKIGGKLKGKLRGKLRGKLPEMRCGWCEIESSLLNLCWKLHFWTYTQYL